MQGTINKKLCILELGVDLTFPSVIRWPFEKVAFYNQKADFIRVNERLYHMSEELKDKGYNIDKKQIKINGTISSLGFHNVDIELHKKVIATIKIELKK